MIDFRLIPLDDESGWLDALARCGVYDSYHLPGYHRVAKEQGEGEPYLFFFENSGHCDSERCAALPFLLRPVADAGATEGPSRCDAVSVYGYPGAVTSVQETEPAAEAFRSAFQVALTEAWNSLRVVSFFGRQHPLIDSSWLFSGVAETVTQGPTVAIDLRQPEEEQVRAMRTNHRRDIRRARTDGMIVTEDPEFRRIDLFRRFYCETMDRVGAASGYYFPDGYFNSLKRHLGNRAKLLFSEQDGKAVSGSIFLLTGDIVQYHLGGTPTEFRSCHGAVKLIFDQMRHWATENGYAWFHLGGGLGASEDSLFRFKQGFSNTRLPFGTVRMIVDPDAYRELTRQRIAQTGDNSEDEGEQSFFPAYRRPAARRAA